MPSVIDDIFENRLVILNSSNYKYSQGKLKDHALKQLSNYLADNISFFDDYPMKALEEIASKIDQRVFNYREVIAKEGQKDFNEMYIIYHGEAACYNLDSAK